MDRTLVESHAGTWECTLNPEEVRDGMDRYHRETQHGRSHGRKQQHRLQGWVATSVSPEGHIFLYLKDGTNTPVGL